MTQTTTSAGELLHPLPEPPSHYQNFVGGTWRDASTSRTVPNLNPANTSQVLGQVPLSGAEDVREAVQAAAKAFPAWRDTPAPARGQILFRALELLGRHEAELGAILTLEEGKIFGEACGEVKKSASILEFIAGEGRRLSGETTPSELPYNFCYTMKQPLGAVALITPWNFPVAIPIWKIAPALVAGNTVVFKPATLTPWTADRIVRIFQEAGLPDGVLNLVYGSGGEVGEALLASPEVRAVSFTGSNEVGSRVYTQGAGRQLKVQCEMGGKNPIVVLEDADLPLAATATAQGAFGSTGQRCTATSRAIVVDQVADAFVREIVQHASRVVVGDGLRAGVTMGPSVDESQLETVVRYLGIAPEEGKVLTGGGRLTDGDHARGYFVEPTVVDHVAPGARIAQEEIFGPVLSIIRVPDFEAALEAANGVEFGLTSSVYTQDVNRIFRFIDRIETGITHVNSPTMGGEAQLPFGGIKGTGVGTREMGKVAIDFFTELKTVYVDYTGRKRDAMTY